MLQPFSMGGEIQDVTVENVELVSIIERQSRENVEQIRL